MKTPINEGPRTSKGGLDPPRFTLRHIFIAVALVAVSIVIFRNYDPLVVTAVAMAIVLIGVHIAGNVLGTRLRSSSSDHQKEGENSRVPTRRAAPNQEDFAPPTKLSHKSSLGWPMLIATCAGIVIGGSSGYAAMVYFYSDRLEAGAVAVGVIAAMALGGFWFFWCWSLAQVVLTAWWHAHSSETHDQKRRK